MTSILNQRPDSQESDAGQGPARTISTLPMSCRGRLWLISLVVGVALSGRLFAGVTAAGARLGWPTTDFKTVLKDIYELGFVVITYSDGSETFVTDTEWIGRLKQLLGSAAGKPAQYCFCINYPQIAFANKDRMITRMEVAHGCKLRFYSSQYSGDFAVDEKIAKQVDKMLLSQREGAVSPHKAPSIAQPPAKVEINLEGDQSPQPTPTKGG